MPHIPLPVFSGNLNEWVYFREKFKFKSLISENAAFNDVQKHHYLRNSLLGEAETLQLTSDTLESLWNALTDRYAMSLCMNLLVETHYAVTYEPF
jgi:hypothetical protein